MSTGGSGNYRPFFLPSWSSARVFPLGSKSATLSARLPTAAAAPTMVAIAARTKMASCAMAITPLEAPPASDLAGDESILAKYSWPLTCVNVEVHLFSRTAAERQGPVSRVLGRQAPGRRFEAPAAKKIEKNFRLARPRQYNAGAFSYDAHAAARGGTPGRPRQVFHFDFPGRSMRRNSPQTARADDRGGAEMIKIRIQGLPEEVAEFADALEAAGCVLERSEPYANRGGSRYVRVYIDAEKRAADGGAREIEEG